MNAIVSFIEPAQVDGVPAAAARLMEWLGFRYLALRRFASQPGSLEDIGLTKTIQPVEAIGTMPEAVPA